MENYTIDQLKEEITTIKGFVKSTITNLPNEMLNQRVSADSWSVLECLEHLNRYSQYYNKALQEAITKHTSSDKQSIKYTWLGKQSIKSISPNNTKKQKTLKHLNPVGSELNKNTITTFLAHQEAFIDILEQASPTNLHKKAIPVEFMKMLKLNIGETLVFVTIHELRHFNQIKNILKNMKTTVS